MSYTSEQWLNPQYLLPTKNTYYVDIFDNKDNNFTTKNPFFQGIFYVQTRNFDAIERDFPNYLRGSHGFPLITSFYNREDLETDILITIDNRNPNNQLHDNGSGYDNSNNIINGNQYVDASFLFGDYEPGTMITSIPYLDNKSHTGPYFLFGTFIGSEDVENFGYQYIVKIATHITSCFNEGTKILCLNDKLEEEYIPIENLKKGDSVKTYLHGYRKIDLIGKNTLFNNPDKFADCMYKMKKTKQNGLIEDLIVTGGHAILVDELGEYEGKNFENYGGITNKIDDKYLLLASVSNDFQKIENYELYTYYNFTLETEDETQRFGVWANGLLTENTFKSDFLKKKYF